MNTNDTESLCFVSEKNKWERLANIVASGGPKPADKSYLKSVFHDAWLDAELGNDEGVGKIRQVLAPVLDERTMQGRSFCKPKGYAGDYEIIDQIYDSAISEDSHLAAWDHYFHSQDAPQAVRNRRAYFVNLLRGSGPQVKKVLNGGSGPGRDLADWLAESGSTGPDIHCLDLDEGSLAAAKRRCHGLSENVEFIQANLLRFRPNCQYDLIWSAGLFDYFNDRLFVAALKRMMRWLAPGGRIVIGNFGDDNPTRPYMEVVGAWYLHHRSPACLQDLAQKAGGNRFEYKVDREQTGVNLFLKVESSDARGRND